MSGTSGTRWWHRVLLSSQNKALSAWRLCWPYAWAYNRYLNARSSRAARGLHVCLYTGSRFAVLGRHSVLQLSLAIHVRDVTHASSLAELPGSRTCYSEEPLLCMLAIYHRIHGRIMVYEALSIFELRVSVENDNLWHYQCADKPEDSFVVFAKDLERLTALSRTTAGYVWVNG